MGGEPGLVDPARDVEQLAPQPPPGRVRRHDAVGPARAAGRRHPGRLGPRQQLDQQPRLADPGLAGHPHHPAGAGRGGAERLEQPAELLVPPHQRGQAPGLAGGPADQARGRRGPGPALEVEQLDLAELEVGSGRPTDLVGDHDPAGRGAAHQAGREVHRAAQAAEGAPSPVAVGAAAQPAGGHADAEVGDRLVLQVEQLQRGRAGPARVVLVRLGAAEDGVEVGALVAHRELEQAAAVPVDDALGRDDECVEQRRSAGVAVEVDPVELDEDGDRGAELGEELPAAGLHARVDRRQQPASGGLGWQSRRVGPARGRRGPAREATDRCHRATGSLPRLHLGHAGAEGGEHRCRDHDLSRGRLVLGCGHLVHQRAGQHVDQLHRRVADHEPLRGAGGDRHLDLQGDRAAAGGAHLAHAGHHLLHREGTAGGQRPVVAVDPAGDGVAAEVDDRATHLVQAADQLVEDGLQDRGEGLCPSLRPQLLGQGLGERGEARDVGEEHRAGAPAVDAAAVVRRPAPVLGDVGLRIVTGGGLARCCFPRGHLTWTRTSRLPRSSDAGLFVTVVRTT